MVLQRKLKDQSSKAQDREERVLLLFLQVHKLQRGPLSG